MSDLETRTLYDADGWRIEGAIDADPDATPYDADCYSTEDIAAWKADRWCYVNVGARVFLHDVQIGQAWLGGVESGQLAEVECDPFELVPAEYGTTDGTPTVTMSSAMTSVVLDAVGEARAWLDKLGPRPADHPELAAIERRFDPNDPETAWDRSQGPKPYDHPARPDDDPEPGDRCKDCGDDITWQGPSHVDWIHVDAQDWRS